MPTAELRATFRATAGRTQMAQLFCKAPLKIARTFPLDDALGVCVMDASPGMLAGDFYEFNWNLEDGARLHITTQGFTRVHPSRDKPCLLRQKISLAAGAHLEFFPEPLMLYKDAALRVETTITLAPEATLLMGEVFCAGRIGHGESFAFSSYENRLRVRRGGALIFANQTALRPASLPPQVLGAWSEWTHGATFYTFAAQTGPALCESLREVLTGTPQIYGGVSLLEGGGVVVSMLGNRACDLQAVLKSQLCSARNHVLAQNDGR